MSAGQMHMQRMFAKTFALAERDTTRPSEADTQNASTCKADEIVYYKVVYRWVLMSATPRSDAGHGGTPPWSYLRGVVWPAVWPLQKCEYA